MKTIIIIFISFILFSAVSCSHPENNTGSLQASTLEAGLQNDTESTNSSASITQADKESAADDSVLQPADSLFNRIELKLKEISKSDFEKYSQASKENNYIDSNGFINALNLSVSKKCHDICETYLVEKSGSKMLMPTDYDAGISGLSFSPSCDQLIVYSSYDGPDYDTYYSHRAEIIGFKITNAKGLNAITPSFSYYSKDWSIDELVWINGSSIALKIYEEEAKDENKMHYKYFKSVINK